MSNMPGVSLASSSISIFRASVRCSSLSLAAMASRSWPLSSDSISSSLYLAGSYGQCCKMMGCGSNATVSLGVLDVKLSLSRA